jgi:hypothetical protein
MTSCKRGEAAFVPTGNALYGERAWRFTSPRTNHGITSFREFRESVVKGQPVGEFVVSRSARRGRGALGLSPLRNRSARLI